MSPLPIIKNKKAKSMKIPISEVRVMDILSDRGKNFTHPGNMYFRCLAQTAVERNRRNPSCTLRPVILVDAMITFLRGKGVRFLKVQKIDGSSKCCYEELCRILTIDKIRNNLRDFVVKDIVAEYPFKDDGAALKEWEAVLDDLCLKHGSPPAAKSSPCVSATKPVVVPALAKSPDCITERVHISPPFMASPWAGRSRGDTPPSMELFLPQQVRYHPARIYPTHLESHNAASFSRNMAHAVNRNIVGFNNYSFGMSSGTFFKNQREADAAMSIVMALRRNEALAKQIHEQDIPANMAVDSWLERR
jgi:hypothetical protein